MACLCIDVGTSIIKTVAYDDGGHELALAREETSVLRPRPGFSEQDMDTVWHAAVLTIRRVVAALSEPVRFLALTAQGDGVWLVDSAGRPTGPAILWNDGRAAGIIERWHADGTLTEAFRRNGTQSFAGLPNGIFAWLRANEPERLERSHRSLCCGGWIFYNLTSQLAIDESDAAAPFLDVRTRRYSSELLELYGLPWAERLLPTLLTDDERVGELTADASDVLGLPRGLPVVMSLYDVASKAIGVGTVVTGQGCSVLGTTLSTEIVVSAPRLDEEPAGFTLPFGPDLYLRAFPTLAGGEVIHWATRHLGLDQPEDLSILAAAAPPGAEGLLCLPYFSPAGERVPFLNPSARGSLHGMSFEHGREHFARAVLEGLSYVVRDCLLVASGPTAAMPRRCALCGGGSNSAFWCQLITDVLGIPTFRLRDQEAGAKGAMIVGLVATGVEKSFAAAQDYLIVRDTFEPHAGRHTYYRERFEQFMKVRESSLSTWRRCPDNPC